MPNWVFNTVSITGDEIAVKALREQLRKPIQTPVMGGYKQVEPLTYKTTSPDWISFQNVIPIPADILDEYHSTCDSEGMASNNNWYKWNCENWGCKWDAGEDIGTLEIESGIGTLSISFDTPWSTPQPIIEKFIEICTDNDFIMVWTYREEQGWGGSVSVDFEGEVSTTEYDIPESHAEYVGLGMADMCRCSEGFEDEYLFSDCPRVELVK